MATPIGHKRGDSRSVASAVLLPVLLAAAQVGSVQAYYACMSDAECQYTGCDDNSCSGYESRTDCKNGVWDPFCTSNVCSYIAGWGESCADPSACVAGTFSFDGKGGGADRACQPCPPGTYAGSAGSYTCTHCAAGKFKASAGVNTACDDCEAGKHKASTGINIACDECGAGKYSAAQGSSECTGCTAGKYKALAGVNTACDNCGAGKYSTSPSASTAVSACFDCAPGSFSSAGSSGCSKCAPGKVAPALGAPTCDQCQQGKFAVSTGSVSCASCPTGKTSVPGSVAMKECNLDADSTVTITVSETVKMAIFLPMDEPQFEEKKEEFKKAIARSAGQAVRADHVTIDSIEKMSTAARRLLAQGVRVAVSVSAVDRSTADAITASLTEDGINNELAPFGFPSATLVQTAFVVDASGENAAGRTEAVLPLGGPWGVVGSTIGITTVFTLLVKWAVVSLRAEQLTLSHSRVALVQDFFDCSLDWISWGASFSEGDLAFSNDKNGVLSGFLLSIATVGVLFFIADLYVYCSQGKISKNLLICKLGLEDFPQTVIYSIVITSQAQEGLKTWGIVCGLGQSLIFCVAKFTEIWIMMNDI